MSAWRKKVLRLLMAVGVLLLTSVALWICLPLPPRSLEDISYSHRVYDRNGQLLRVTLSRDEKYRIYTPLAEIPKDLVEATLLHEDRHYWNHPGVNLVSVFRATWHFCLAHTGRGGASTVSMQLARMRYRLHTRTVCGKLVQIFRALQFERHYSKQQILESYLNLAPYGRNIEGVGAASLIYFGKAPSKLTFHESVALSVIPQSPTRRTPRVERENPVLTAAANRLSSKLLETRGAAQDQPSATYFRAQISNSLPFTAPHFVQQVLRTQPTTTEVKTTLDHSLQRMIERRIAGYLESKGDLGINNSAAMLIDFRSMEVLAQVGSANFRDVSIFGQVDGTQSRRSPGSTLKPFIYSLAIDAGLIHPLTLLKDTPRSFGTYNPENFDRDFVGPIRASDALARSRNVPAVSLAAQLSHPSFYEFLRMGGVELPKREEFYGLALPLGGGEVTMEELVRLYASLANNGRLRQLNRVLPHPEDLAGVRILSTEAAFLTLEMLGGSSRPGLGGGTGSESIYWKTGTSNGFRDAWSVAVFDQYVLAVWLGNFDGKSNPALVGRTCAAPLLFGIIDAIRTQRRSAPIRRTAPVGANLKQVEFCSVSGQLPTTACKHRVSGWFLPGISSIQQCNIHREVLLDATTGLRVARDDGTRALRREIYEFWPSDLLQLFRQAGVPRRQPPPFLPGSSSGQEAELATRIGQSPRIVSPQPGQIYALRTDSEIGRTLPLRAQVEAGVNTLYWFANEVFLGSGSAPEAFFWKAEPGTYRIVALDDQGRSGSCTVTLQTVAKEDG